MVTLKQSRSLSNVTGSSSRTTKLSRDSSVVAFRKDLAKRRRADGLLSPASSLASAADNGPRPRRLWIGNLHPTATPEDLGRLFKKCGVVEGRFPVLEASIHIYRGCPVSPLDLEWVDPDIYGPVYGAVVFDCGASRENALDLGEKGRLELCGKRLVLAKSLMELPEALQLLDECQRKLDPLDPFVLSGALKAPHTAEMPIQLD